ncbi:hypothetical protein HMPREF3220_02208 [Citrobacter koseri]|nr:hypothetical protein HMPREF3220_02208 [Citrobacter koseri]
MKNHAKKVTAVMKITTGKIMPNFMLSPVLVIGRRARIAGRRA